MNDHNIRGRFKQTRLWRRALTGSVALFVTSLVLFAAPLASATAGRPATERSAAQAALPAETPSPGSTFTPPIVATPNAPTPTFTPAPPTPTLPPTATPVSTTAPTTAPTPTLGTVTTTATPGGTPTTTPGATATATATLGHVPSGTLSVSYTSTTHVARTTLNMTGLAQGGTAVTVVMSGTCSAPGGVAWQGAPFTADANGKVSNFKVNYRNVKGVPTGDVVGIQTVQSGNETRANYLLACGPIASTGNNKGSVNLGPVPGAVDGNITGSATLAQANGSLVVTIKASGLQPGSTNATALDLGSCQWQDYVLYNLPAMTADSSGNGQVTMTIQNAQPISSSNNWYIAIDYNATINNAYFMTVGCGNIVVSSS